MKTIATTLLALLHHERMHASLKIPSSATVRRRAGLLLFA